MQNIVLQIIKKMSQTPFASNNRRCPLKNRTSHIPQLLPKAANKAALRNNRVFGSKQLNI